MESRFYTLLRRFARGILALLGPVRLHGVEKLPPSGPVLLACNHLSHFDPPLVAALCPRPVDWMAMQELFRSRFWCGFFEKVGAFPTDRTRVDRAAVRITLERLRAGRLVGIFPEGGIRTGSQSVLEGGPMRPGVAALAQMASAPVVPCVVLGTQGLYRPMRWLPWPWSRSKLEVRFGAPLLADPALPREQARAELEAALARAFRELGRGGCEG